MLIGFSLGEFPSKVQELPVNFRFEEEKIATSLFFCCCEAVLDGQALT